MHSQMIRKLVPCFSGPLPLMHEHSSNLYSALDDNKVNYEYEVKQLLTTFFPPKICDIIVSFLAIQRQLIHDNDNDAFFNPFQYDKYSVFDFILFLLNIWPVYGVF
eukprot:516614_1